MVFGLDNETLWAAKNWFVLHAPLDGLVKRLLFDAFPLGPQKLYVRKLYTLWMLGPYALQ